MRLFRRLSHQPKGEENIKSDWSIYRILAPSVIGIFICAVCLCGVSWAWFTANVSVEATTIKTASYTVSVTAKDSGNNEITPTTSDDGAITVTFSSAGAYTVTIAPDTSSNTATSGYCTIGFNGTTYYTGQLVTDSFSLTVNTTTGNQTLTVTPQWGTYSGSGQTISSGGSIGTAAENSDENASEESQSLDGNEATQETSTTGDATQNGLAMESSSVNSSSASDSSTESGTSESDSALTPSTSAQSETSDANSSFAQEVVTTEGKTAA